MRRTRNASFLKVSFVAAVSIAYHDPTIGRILSPTPAPVATPSFGNSMELSNEYRRIQSHPEALPVVLEILMEQSQYVDRSEFLAFALPKIAKAVAARYVAIARASGGQWRAEPNGSPRHPALPLGLLGDALDAEEARGQDPWVAAPLVTRIGAGELLVAELTTGLPPHRLTDL